MNDTWIQSEQQMTEHSPAPIFQRPFAGDDSFFMHGWEKNAAGFFSTFSRTTQRSKTAGGFLTPSPWTHEEQTQRPSAGLPGARCGAHTALRLPTANVGAIGQGHKDGWTPEVIRGRSWESYTYQSQRYAKSHRNIKVRRSPWHHLLYSLFKRRAKLSQSHVSFPLGPPDPPRGTFLLVFYQVGCNICFSLQWRTFPIHHNLSRTVSGNLTVTWANSLHTLTASHPVPSCCCTAENLLYHLQKYRKGFGTHITVCYVNITLNPRWVHKQNERQREIIAEKRMQDWDVTRDGLEGGFFFLLCYLGREHKLSHLQGESQLWDMAIRGLYSWVRWIQIVLARDFEGRKEEENSCVRYRCFIRNYKRLQSLLLYKYMGKYISMYTITIW